jgi:acetolactate synthase-1/2/3 large subunit
MSELRGADAIVRILEGLDVDVVFGLCGDTSLPFYDALANSEQLRLVLTRDERCASFMADAYARLSGRVGVCEGPSGGGATYILPGVAEANVSSVPLVCLTSDIGVEDRGKGTLTELDQAGLFAPVSKQVFSPTSGADLPHMLRSAFREATTGSLGACHVSLPLDVQGQPVDASDVHADERFGRYPNERLAPSSDEVKAAARLLVESRRPLLVAGAGTLRSGAWHEVIALSHALGAPVATSICGKGAIAETDAFSLGVIGSNGGLPWRHELVRQADLVFYIGSGAGSVTTEKWTLPAPGSTTVLQLDTNQEVIGRVYDVSVGVHSDASLGLAAVLEEVVALGASGVGDRVDPAEIAAGHEAHMERVAHLFDSGESPIRPERLMRELFAALPKDSVIVADPGTPCPYVSAYWRLESAGRWFVSPRAFGALGYSLPGVVGAHYAKPEAGRVVGIMGDGSFGISAGELETLVRLQVPVTLIVCNNASYGWIKAGQKSRGDAYYSVDFGRSDHAAIARAYGMSASRVEDPADLSAAMHDALAAQGPYLLDVITQPLEEANAPVSKWIA